MKLSINLASRHYFNRRILKLTLSCIIVFLLLILAIQGNIYLQNHQLTLQYQSHLGALQEQLHGKMPKRLTPEELAVQRQAYRKAEALLQKDSFRWTVLFNRMENLLPDGVSLRSFNPDYNKNSLMIHGVAKNLKKLRNLLDNLQGASFKQVYLKNQGEVDVENGRGGKRGALSFSIAIEGIF